MEALSLETKKLLDKLYNLRSDDSAILSDIEVSKQKAEETLEQNNIEKDELQKKIEKLSNEEGLLKEQSFRLMEVLSNINEDDFSLVLERLDIPFHPKEMEEKLNSALPNLLEKVDIEAKEAKEQLKNVEDVIIDASTKIEELAIRKDTAIANQQKLNEYFDLALNGNLNITRESISSLLEQFNFSEDEQKEAAKLIMFPEDALYDYDRETKGGTILTDVFTVKDEAKDNTSSDNNEIVDIMKKVGLNYLDYSSADLNKLSGGANEAIITSNINYIKQNNIALDIFSDNVELLYDPELIKKIEKLFALGKSAIDVYLNPGVLKKYDLEGLEKVVSDLQKSGLDPKMVPLMAY